MAAILFLFPVIGAHVYISRYVQYRLADFLESNKAIQRKNLGNLARNCQIQYSTHCFHRFSINSQLPIANYFFFTKESKMF